MDSKNPASAAQVAKFKEFARFVIEHHFGSRPRRVSFESGGLSNFVFTANHKEGDFVVRISPDASRINTFIKEQWVQTAARKSGVPTAEILETGYSAIPFPYMISRSIKGMPGTIHPEQRKLMAEMGKVAARINSIRTKGFGETFDWSNNQLSRNETWRAYLTNEYRFEEKVGSLERSKIVPPETLKRLMDIMVALLKKPVKPVLNHGDLRLKNIIADEKGKILAVLDWEKATSNLSPAWEMAAALHDLGIDDKQTFVEHYGLTNKQLNESSPYIKAFNLLNYSLEIERCTQAKDHGRLDRLKQRFAGAFDLYSVS